MIITITFFQKITMQHYLVKLWRTLIGVWTNLKQCKRIDLSLTWHRLRWVLQLLRTCRSSRHVLPMNNTSFYLIKDISRKICLSFLKKAKYLGKTVMIKMSLLWQIIDVSRYKKTKIRRYCQIDDILQGIQNHYINVRYFWIDRFLITLEIRKRFYIFIS